MAATPPETHDYTVQSDGWVQNRLRKKGDTLKLTETAAQYDVLGGKLERKKAKSKTAQAAT